MIYLECIHLAISHVNVAEPENHTILDLIIRNITPGVNTHTVIVLSFANVYSFIVNSSSDTRLHVNNCGTALYL